MKRHLAVVALAACSAVAIPAFAETTECTVISSLPATISAPGVYCLKSDLMTSITTGSAISINSNFVTLDLNGWRLGGGAAGMGTQAIGIHALDRRGVTIRNGSVKGFWVGIFLEGTLGTTNVVEGIRADGNTAMGLDIWSADSIIRNNQVTNTGGSTLGNYDDADGIHSAGSGNRILNNDVSGVVASKENSYARGIYSGGVNTISAGNRISDIQSALSIVRGIQTSNAHVIADNQIVGATGVSEVSERGIDSGGNSVIRNNLISGYTIGVAMSATSTIYSGNVVVGAATPYSGGTAHVGTNAP
jgi:hypothetical protein